MKRRKYAEEKDGTNGSVGPTPTMADSDQASPVPEEGDESITGSVRRRSSRKDIPSAKESEAASAPPEESADEESGGSDEPGETTSEDVKEETVVATPAKRPRGRPKGTTNATSSNVNTPTKSVGLLGKKLFSTPAKASGESEGTETPRIQRNANRSARRKSARSLIEKTILGQNSDNDDEDEEIAEQIYNSGEEEDGEDGDDKMVLDSAPVTPSRRGRPKGSRNRTPTPPPDMSAAEKYFFDNRGGHKTSNNNLSTLALLDHEEYFSRSRKLEDRHENDLQNLESIHSDQFNRWEFELSQDFNLCLYGFGSKRSLLLKFADHVYKSHVDHAKSKIVIVNGYVATLTVRDVLKTVASAISETVLKYGSPGDMLEAVFELLEEDKSTDITLLIHSIDALPLRRPATQTTLSRLSSHPQIHLVASADHPNFPILWDSSLRSTFNFLFHDCTTFRHYDVEYDVIDEVHELLGRSGRRVGGKEGVSFVLKSLPENAKNLFRVLIGEQLATMDENAGMTIEDEDDEENEQRAGAMRSNDTGVEYRVLYQKAVEEFICSNEMNFRTLLKEFHDHQMIQSRKDALGTEILSIPFRKEELETILEDIMS